MAASAWAPGGEIIVANAEQGALIQKFSATPAQTVFPLTQFNYVINTGSLRVYRNGVKLEQSSISEDSSVQFSLVGIVLGAGEIIEATAVLGSQDAVIAAAEAAAASAASAVASAASINPTNLVHINGAETITGVKTFSAGTFKLNNLADTFASLFASAATAIRTITFPDKTGTVVVTSNGAVNTLDITDANITQVKLGPNVAGNGPAFSAWQSTLQAIATGAVARIFLQSEEFDTANAFDSTTNSQFQPLIAGYYSVVGNVDCNVYNSNSIAVIYKNGVEYKQGSQSAPASAAGSSVSCLVYLNGTTDYVDLRFLNGTAGSINTVAAQSKTYFQGFLARAA